MKHVEGLTLKQLKRAARQELHSDDSRYRGIDGEVLLTELAESVADNLGILEALDNETSLIWDAMLEVGEEEALPTNQIQRRLRKCST